MAIIREIAAFSTHRDGECRSRATLVVGPAASRKRGELPRGAASERRV